MDVKVISATPYPAFVCSTAAGICYGKDNASRKRLRTCFNADHLSVFEHASATFSVEGISRACMAQLTRHRLCSFCVESQRYCKYDEEFFAGNWYVMPPEFEGWKVHNPLTEKEYRAFDAFMKDRAREYLLAIDKGMKPEDARYLLPEATKTNLMVTMNARQLFHVLDMRADGAAQWEIQAVANAMLEELKAEGEEWAFIVGLWEGKREQVL